MSSISATSGPTRHDLSKLQRIEVADRVDGVLVNVGDKARPWPPRSPRPELLISS